MFLNIFLIKLKLTASLRITEGFLRGWNDLFQSFLWKRAGSTFRSSVNNYKPTDMIQRVKHDLFLSSTSNFNKAMRQINKALYAAESRVLYRTLPVISFSHWKLFRSVQNWDCWFVIREGTQICAQNGFMSSDSTPAAVKHPTVTCLQMCARVPESRTEPDRFLMQRPRRSPRSSMSFSLWAQRWIQIVIICWSD